MVTQWVSVDKRLPEVGKGVLLYSSFAEGVQTIGYLKEDGAWKTLGGYSIGLITHWMPLPNAPRKEDWVGNDGEEGW